MKTEIKIEGMSCQHCVNHTTEALKGLSGISSVEVNLEQKQALVESVDKLDEDRIKAVIDEAGYQVVAINEI